MRGDRERARVTSRLVRAAEPSDRDSSLGLGYERTRGAHTHALSPSCPSALPNNTLHQRRTFRAFHRREHHMCARYTVYTTALCHYDAILLTVFDRCRAETRESPLPPAAAPTLTSRTSRDVSRACHYATAARRRSRAISGTISLTVGGPENL